MTRLVCTIATCRQLPHARALAWSLRRHDPQGRLLVLMLDDRRHEVQQAREPFLVVRPPALDIARFELLAGMHAASELELIVKPALLRYALDRVGGPVLLLGVDALVLASLENLYAAARGRQALLVPRLQAPVPRDHVRLTDSEIVKLGAFDNGCLMLTPSDDVDAVLRAWSDRLELDRGDELPLPAGRFLDLFPGLLGNAHVVRDPTVDVSRHNLHERIITSRGEGFAVSGRPLVIVRCDGLDGAEEPPADPFGGPQDGGPPSADDRSRTPQAARETMQRALLDRQPVLRKLVRERQRLLAGCGIDIDGRRPYGYERLADGTPLSRRLRRAVRDAELFGGLSISPFDALGTHDLLDWLNAPAEHGSGGGLTRYWFEIYRERPDLQAFFPDLDGAGGSAMALWAREAGRQAYATPQVLLPFD